MKGLSLKFDQFGGYDCMTGSWVIYKDDRPILDVDQGRFGQAACDHDFRSESAKKIAEICYEALLNSPEIEI
jgi:hypothetical protein